MGDKPEDILLDGILDSLEDIGYGGSLLKDGQLEAAIKQGLSSQLFIELCTSLCSELKELNNLQESVTKPTSISDGESFEIEMRSFLKELHCPHQSLTNDRDLLTSYSKKLLLIDFLLSEVLTARLLSVRREEEEKMEVDRDESHSVQASLEAILKVYGLNKPPAHITVKQIFDRIIGKTKQVVAECPKEHIGTQLVKQPLSDEQWGTLDRINDSLTQEYAVRRQMLLTRCDVTVQTFGWSDRVKGKKDEFTETYQHHRQHLHETSPVSLARVLAAREDLLTIEKTNSPSVRAGTVSSVNKVLIGKVPDRGGRPRETRPPPEMPAFRKRTEAPPQGQRSDGKGRGQKGGRGGGRVQGGWSGGRGGHKGGGGGWHQKGGGHHGYGGGGHQHHQQYHS